MAKGKRSQEATPEANDPQVAAQTGGVTTEVENEGLEVQEDGSIQELSKEDQQASIAGSMGGTDNYAYVDRTAVPMHERNTISMNSSPLDEASQAELNPAFTAKKEDGGPVNADGEGIGSEPNAFEQQAAAAENTGGEDARKAVEEQQAAGAEAQMDVDAVNAQAEANSPDNVDASTGQKEA